MAAAGGAKRIVVLGNNNNFFFLEDGREREGAFGSFSPFQLSTTFSLSSPALEKKRSKTKKERKNTRETKREERVVASIKKKTKPALFLSFFLRINMAVTLSGSRFSGAFSSCDSAIINGTNGTSALRGCLFFYYFFRGAFSPNERKTNKERKKK